MHNAVIIVRHSVELAEVFLCRFLVVMKLVLHDVLPDNLDPVVSRRMSLHVFEAEQTHYLLQPGLVVCDAKYMHEYDVAHPWPTTERGAIPLDKRGHLDVIDVGVATVRPKTDARFAVDVPHQLLELACQIWCCSFFLLALVLHS